MDEGRSLELESGTSSASAEREPSFAYRFAKAPKPKIQGPVFELGAWQNWDDTTTLNDISFSVPVTCLCDQATPTFFATQDKSGSLKLTMRL
ncbi:hypothetical protein PanWU01x14_125460 [Parasponia andersonii]|uniref:Uncharacterized protein n=1 Tax=Parasponia andersonii TaxID=3476 RepID=A0A2P5CT69_PARAD|nr:hypothetical protein PanWU01x14_125460 [Parasponia andersonii]